jgi:hypothetical protein
LLPNGDGLQSVYLTEVNPSFAAALLGLIGAEAQPVVDAAKQMHRVARVSPAPEPTLDEWEARIEAALRENKTIADTDRQALILARRGQGQFRANVQRIERACRVTKVERLEHLIASHAKPWRDSSNDERLNGENGFLLTPTVDHLFDKGFISFDDNGDLIVSPVADPVSLRRMGIAAGELTNVGPFSEGQRSFLEFHRDNVLRMANREKRR